MVNEPFEVSKLLKSGKTNQKHPNVRMSYESFDRFGGCAIWEIAAKAYCKCVKLIRLESKPKHCVGFISKKKSFLLKHTHIVRALVIGS